MCLFVLWHINLLGHLMPNQVKNGGTEKSIMLEFICREMVCIQDKDNEILNK